MNDSTDREKTASTGSAGPGRRILVIDDNHDSADAMAMLLRMRGHELRVAYGGPEGIAAAKDFRPQLIFLDIGLPEMDGFEVARRLRREPEGQEVRLIALTGFGEELDRQRTSEAGFDHHLLKPATIQNIEELIRSL